MYILTILLIKLCSFADVRTEQLNGRSEEGCENERQIKNT